MSNIFNSDDFGLKIYNRFPPKYREDDVGQRYALKRYLQALSDGGFKHSIDEINGLTTLIDPENADAKVLPVLFQQYGLNVFNGIPENYLRYLLPKLGEAWSKKGSLDVVEFITASLSGIKTSSQVIYDENEDPIIGVKLEMDYNIGDYFPDAEQFTRLLENFVPFYCDVSLIYSYLFYESQVFGGIDFDLFGSITTTYDASASLSVGEELDAFENRILENAVEDKGRLNLITDSSATNRVYNTLNGSFITNGLYCYDKITINGVTEVVF